MYGVEVVKVGIHHQTGRTTGLAAMGDRVALTS